MDGNGACFFSMLRLALTSEMYSIFIHADVVDHIPKNFQHFSDFITDIEEYLSKQLVVYVNFDETMGVRGGGRARLQVKLRVREWYATRTGVSPT